MGLRTVRAVALFVALFTLLAIRPDGAAAAAIPSPQQYFGFELGTSGKLARFDKITQYLKLIGDNSTRADYQVLGKTVLGKDFPLMHISSPANLQRVDEILAANDRLADPRGLTEEDAKALAADHIPVYYLEAGMHSTEVGPVQVIPNIVHRLATERSPEINKILNEMLIVLLPAANPDGSHLVTDYFNETEGTGFTRTYPDLYHHYTGHDDNRDWLFFTQPESKLRIGVFRKYKPVVEHILHQAGAIQPAHVGPALQRRRQRDPRRPRHAVDERDRHGRRPRPLRREQEGRQVGRLLRDLGHRGHPELRDVRGLGAAAVRGRVADQPRLSVLEPERLEPSATRSSRCATCSPTTRACGRSSRCSTTSRPGRSWP